MSLVVCTYWWQPDEGSKFSVPYGTDDVRRLQQMVAKNLTIPHQFACITDQPELFDGDPDIHAIAIDKTTHVPGTCYVRLMTFHPEGREMIGDKVLQLDLDTLIVGNIDHLVSREEDLVLWRNPTLHPKRPGRSLYNTSILLHRCGTRSELWRAFLELGKANIPAKDDQWYLADALGTDVPYFDGARDGVYRMARVKEVPAKGSGTWKEEMPGSGVWGPLADNACIVTFPGSDGKWSEPHIREANPWIERFVT